VRVSSLLGPVLTALPALAAGCHVNDGPPSWTVADSSTSACPATAAVLANGSCTAPQGTICKSDVPRLDCSGQMVGFVGCTCAAGTWMCGASVVPGCSDGGDDATTGEGGQGNEAGAGDASDDADGAAGCPPETLVAAGDACAVPQSLTCKSAAHTFDCDAQVDGYVSCSCVNSAWSCGPSSTCADGGVDAGSDAGSD
jgi:hypothetical protein